MIQAHINAGTSLADAVNSIFEKYDLVRTDRQGFTCVEESPFITLINTLRARKTTGLMARRSYKSVTGVTRGLHYPEQKS